MRDFTYRESGFIDNFLNGSKVNSNIKELKDKSYEDEIDELLDNDYNTYYYDKALNGYYSRNKKK